MKKVIYSVLFLTALLSCQHKPGYKIEASVPDMQDGLKVYLMEWQDKVDSTLTKDGKFIFIGQVDVPRKYGVWIDMSPEETNFYRKDLRGAEFYVDNQSDVKIEVPSIDSIPGSMKQGKLRISGSPTEDLYQSYKNAVQPYADRKAELWDQYLQEYHIPAGEDTAFHTRRGIELVKGMQEMKNKMYPIQLEFIKKYPQSPISVDIAYALVQKNDNTKAEMDEIFRLLDPSLRCLPLYKELQQDMEAKGVTAKGEKYTDIELKDVEGQTVHLSDYIKPGEYNMVEFWASWCGPCRYEIPHLRHVHEVYGEDLNIISVSLDDNEAAWKKALAEEKMNWTQLNDSKGWKGEVCHNYHVQGIPFSLLIDQEGKIITRGVRGSELDIILIDRLGYKFKE